MSQLIQNNTTLSQNIELELYKAIFLGNRSTAMSIIDKNPSCLYASINGRSETPLHVAVGVNRANLLVPLLLKKVPHADNLTYRDIEQNTVLMVAAMVGNTRAAAMLLANNTNRQIALLFSPNANGSTPLLTAAEYGNKRMIRYLLYFLIQRRQWIRLSHEFYVSFVKHLFVAGFYDLALYAIESTQMLELLNPTQSTFIPACYESFLEIVAGKSIQFSIWHLWNSEIYVQVIKSLCKKIARSGDYSMFRKPLLLAAKLGVQEVVVEILNSYPDAILFIDDDGRNIYHLSVIHRQENIFGFLCGIYGYKNMPIAIKDKTGKNILHLVAETADSDKLTSLCGPALRMQYEIKWYKEVKKHIQPSYSTEVNGGKTPRMMFTEAHQKLVKAGDKWIKGAATAGSVAATLITTIVFAAAINVPGGSKDEKGSPNLIEQDLFHVFLYADGLSLFLSLSSVLMFMSILASGDAESGFLDALPNRLIFGLVTLLFSLTSMIVAFWAAFLLASGNIFNSVTSYILLQFTYIPGFLFVYLLYPLLSQMIKLTWLRSTFRCRSTRNLSWCPCILSILLLWEHLRITATKWFCCLEVAAVQLKETLLCACFKFKKLVIG